MKSGSNKLARVRPLLGTFVEIRAEGVDTAALERAIEAAFGAVERVHQLMSFHEAGSDIGRLNETSAGKTVVVHEWTYEVLAAAIDLHQRSRGSFNIAVAPALQRLGLLPDAVPGPRAPCAPICEEPLQLLGRNRVCMRATGSKIDVGGIAKGFAVDQAVAVLHRHGIASGLVNAGGDLAGFGSGEHKVAIRDPRHPCRLFMRTAVRNAAIASSGCNFDAVRSAPHAAIIDPKTGAAVATIAGATVRAPRCMIADGLTKVVMIAGVTAAAVLDHYGASALFVMANGDVQRTADWQDVYPFAA